MNLRKDRPDCYEQQKQKQQFVSRLENAALKIVNLSRPIECAESDVDNNQVVVSSNEGKMSNGDNLWHQQAHLLALQLRQQQQQQQALAAGAPMPPPLMSSMGIGAVMSHGLPSTAPPSSRGVTLLEASCGQQQQQQQQASRASTNYLAEFLAHHSNLNDYHNHHHHQVHPHPHHHHQADSQLHHSPRPHLQHLQQSSRTFRDKTCASLQASSPPTALLTSVSTAATTTAPTTMAADEQREAQGVVAWPTFACHPNERQQSLLHQQLHHAHPSPQPSSTVTSPASIDIYSRHIGRAFQLMLYQQRQQQADDHHQHSHNHHNHHHHHHQQQQQSLQPAHLCDSGAAAGRAAAAIRVESIYSTLRSYALGQTYMKSGDAERPDGDGGGAYQLAATTFAGEGATRASAAGVSVATADLPDKTTTTTTTAEVGVAQSAYADGNHERAHHHQDGDSGSSSNNNHSGGGDSANHEHYHCHNAPPSWNDPRQALSSSPNQRHRAASSDWHNDDGIDAALNNDKLDRSTSDSPSARASAAQPPTRAESMLLCMSPSPSSSLSTTAALSSSHSPSQASFRSAQSPTSNECTDSDDDDNKDCDKYDCNANCRPTAKKASTRLGRPRADKGRVDGAEQLPGPDVLRTSRNGCGQLSSVCSAREAARHGSMEAARTIADDYDDGGGAGVSSSDEESDKKQHGQVRRKSDGTGTCACSHHDRNHRHNHHHHHKHAPSGVGECSATNAAGSGAGAPSNNSRIRTAYSSMQILNLEREFSANMYLSRIRRIELSQKLKLSEKQVKIWFQNRRVKHKKESSQHQHQSARLIAGKLPPSHCHRAQ